MAAMRTALLVSPDAPTRDSLIAALNGSGIAAVAASECDTALRCLASVKADIVLLDTTCSNVAGLREDVRELSGPIPVLYIAGRDPGYSPVAFTRNGNGYADQVIRRPFDPSDVVAAAKAALGLGIPVDGGPVRFGDVLLDPERHTVSVNGSRVSLTPTEFRIVRCLAGDGSGPVPIDTLFRRVWGCDPGAAGGDRVRAHVRNLRSKLRRATGRDGWIENVPRRGYRLAVR